MICHINLAKGYRGGERQTEILVKELSNRGFRQRIYVRKNSKLIENLKDVKNLEIIELKKPFIFSVFKFKGCRILHAHEKKAEQLAFFVYFFFKIPYFITRRVDFLPKKNFFNRAIYKNAKKVFAISNVIKDLMKENFEVNVELIPSVSSMLKTTEKLKILKNEYKNKFIVLNIGALVNSHKGQEYIIKAANLLRSYKDIVFLILGEGKDKEYYEKLIKKYNLTNLKLVGFKNNVGDYLEISDIFLFPSLQEGLGSILIDAMDFAKPIIATNVGGISDLIRDNYNGILIESKNEKLIKDAIIKLYLNKDLRDKLALNAKNEVKKYNIENIVDLYINNYQSVKEKNES